jgi:hypothetical protein
MPEEPSVAGIAAMELVAGCRDASELRGVMALLLPMRVLWPPEPDMPRALIEFMPMRLAHGLGILDALIAATAIGYGLPLATFNTRHFQHIPGLTIVQPYTR